MFSGEWYEEWQSEMWQCCPLQEPAALSPALSCMDASAESLLTQKKVDCEQIKLFEMKLLSHSPFLPHPKALLTSSKFCVKLIVPSLQRLHQTMLPLSQASPCVNPRIQQGKWKAFLKYTLKKLNNLLSLSYLHFVLNKTGHSFYLLSLVLTK